MADPVHESPRTLYVTILDFADGTAQVVTHRYLEGAKTRLSLTPFTRYERGDAFDEAKAERDRLREALISAEVELADAIGCVEMDGQPMAAWRDGKRRTQEKIRQALVECDGGEDG